MAALLRLLLTLTFAGLFIVFLWFFTLGTLIVGGILVGALLLFLWIQKIRAPKRYKKDSKTLDHDEFKD